MAVLAGGRLVAAGDPWEVLRAETIEGAFGAPVVVMRHPGADRPLVVAAP